MPGGKGEHYKGTPRGPPTTQLDVLTEPTPLTITEGPGLCHCIAPRCSLHFSHRSFRKQEVKTEV